MYVRPYTMAALAAVGGAIGGAVLWGWPRESRRAAARNAAVGVLLALATAYVVWPEWSPFAKGARDMARNASCQANLKSLGLSLRMYAEAWDGRLPPCKTANDLVGVDYDKLRAMLAQRPPVGPPWAALGGGPLHEVLRNAQMFGCPSDPANFDWRGRPVLDRYPEPGVSYAWNAKWAGKRITSVPDGEWLLRDREPWHHGGWNVVFRDARVKWQRPVEAPR
jgi:hypothetical protein